MTSPVQCLKIIRDVPKAELDDYGKFTSFMQTLTRCLTYHHEFHHDDHVSTDQSDLLFYQQLARDFFSKLYIDRDERAELQADCLDSGVVLLAGARGSGKTTLLLKIKDELSSDARYFVHYINLKKKTTQIRVYQSLGRPPGAPFCIRTSSTTTYETVQK